MPKLGHPYLTKGKAIAYLLDLYRNDSEFVKELDEIRRPYMPLLFNLARAILSFSAESKKALTSQDYWTLVACFQGKSQQAPNLPTEVEEQKERMKQLGDKLQPYATALGKFAFKWKLRAPWAVQTLISYDIFDFATAMGLPTQVDVPIESLGELYPWRVGLPDLEIKASPWVFFLSSRGQIEKEIAMKLEQHENRIKSAGFHEFPSALRNHAKWWFEHYVHRKPYDEIAQMEAYTPAGSLIAHATNVGDAVRRFSKLIGMRPKTLK